MRLSATISPRLPITERKERIKTVRFNFKDDTFIGKPNGTDTIPRIETYEVSLYHTTNTLAVIQNITLLMSIFTYTILGS